MTMHLSRRLAMSLIAGATIATVGVATPAWAAHYRVAADLQSQVNEYMVLWANAAKEHPAVKDGTISDDPGRTARCCHPGQSLRQRDHREIRRYHLQPRRHRGWQRSSASGH